jgi:EF hand
MKILLGALLIATLASPLRAQTNAPIRLAIISETAETALEADLLTAQFSSETNLHLLERNEIGRIYREQALSAANGDFVKLGQILGADGLLLLNVNKTAQTTNLTARLVAVQPGVALSTENFPWPLPNVAEWSPDFARHLAPLLPKLGVLEKDAIPISIVNLRSAIQSDEARQTEQDLRLLTIQRLSQEKPLFVLERQRMELLTQEKDFKSDTSPFWNGSYLLEGTLDQNGYAKETITLNAQLTPPKGGTPILIELTTSRTNLTDLINQLTSKVEETLKIHATAPAWNASDEAQQYYIDGKWALRWGLNAGAQAAADSAWALGKRDLDCAVLRIRARLAEASAGDVSYDFTTSHFGPEYFTNVPVALHAEQPIVIRQITQMKAQSPFGMFYRIKTNGTTVDIDYASARKAPDTLNIDRATHALELYADFCKTSTEGEPKLIPRGGRWNNWHDSDWYQLGIDNLTEASTVLNDFYLHYDSQAPAADKLEELRAQSRSVAAFIAQSPSVRDSYFVGNRSVKEDVLHLTMDQSSTIFRCVLMWGPLWQETPEDGLALYRNLMSSPVFYRLNSIFWGKLLQKQQTQTLGQYLVPPRLIAWHEADRARIPQVWGGFLRELDNSTNLLWQLQARALRFADATDAQTLSESFTALTDAMTANYAALLTNNVESLAGNLDRDIDNLIDSKTPPLWKESGTKFNPLNQTFRFERQKQYLAENKTFDPQTFNQVFTHRFPDYTPDQAGEMKTLLDAYKTNLTGNMKTITPQVIGAFEADIDRKLGVTTTTLPPQTPRSITAATQSITTNALDSPTNLLVISRFSGLPLDLLPGTNQDMFQIISHHDMEGKLLLEFRYRTFILDYDDEGQWTGVRRSPTINAIALLSPETGQWEIIQTEEDDNGGDAGFGFYFHRTVLWHGNLFTCAKKQISRYDAKSKQWQVLPISDGASYELFVVNDHLYAANPVTVFEIMEDGNSTHLLASTRRQPPVTALDKLDLGTPTLFAGPNRSLRIAANHRIFTWRGDDWREDSSAPPASQPPEISADDVLFDTFALGDNPSIYRLGRDANLAEFCLGQFLRSSAPASPRGSAVPPAKPIWNLPADLSLYNLPSASHQKDLYLLVDHSTARRFSEFNSLTQVFHLEINAKDGYHAQLLRFSPGLFEPQSLFLKFDAPNATAPLAGINPAEPPPAPRPPTNWMFFAGKFLVFGNNGDGLKPGVWLAPISDLESALEPQKKTLLAQKTQAQATASQIQKDLLAKYDRNHNGVINTEEREDALDDPAFVESVLDIIDANHNGWLDAEEMSYFDANHDGILDPKEQAGIETAQHLFATQLFKNWDMNGDGFLDRPEFEALWTAISGTFKMPVPLGFQAADTHHRARLDQADLETFLRGETLRSLAISRSNSSGPSRELGYTDRSQVPSPQQRFKQTLESYWRNTQNSPGKSPVNDSLQSTNK